MTQKIDIMDGPFSAALIEDTDGVLYREIKTVRIKNSMLTEYVTRREYAPNSDDYNDVSTVRPLAKVEV